MSVCFYINVPRIYFSGDRNRSIIKSKREFRLREENVRKEFVGGSTFEDVSFFSIVLLLLFLSSTVFVSCCVFMFDKSGLRGLEKRY